MDILLSLEWGSISAYINEEGSFTKKILSDKNGWWSFVLPVDIDNDGDIDLIAGNLGLNSRIKASDKEQVKLYYNDFDNNGKKEQVLSYYVNGREIPFANKAELEKQIPVLKKKFLYAKDFAKASFNDIFTEEKLSSSTVYSANYFSNAIFINDGKMNFKVQALPWKAQLTSYKDAEVVDANGDNLPDILLAGNYYANNIEMGRYDADFSTLLINKGNDQFVAESLPGLQVKGEVRHIRTLKIGREKACIMARNNDSAIVVSFNEKR
jgi:hypothetical protein